jgi:tetratricopeptide (TPR) repeat protein
VALLRTLFAALLTATGLLLASGSALAQSWNHPELVDYDKAREEYSPFWEQALLTDEESYRGLVKQARAIWNAGGSEQRALALATLRTAASSKPEKPHAHFWLGQFLYADQEWEACAAALSKVYSMEPGFQPDDLRSRNTLDFNLASCLLYSGEYEGAIEHFKRIITLDYASDRVQLRLGEAYMALGRLNEAIEFLTLAARPNGRLEARFALAVAFDRAERLNASREELAYAVKRDRDLGVLRSADKSFAPAEDEHYYLGLAYGQQNKKTRALYHFRRYEELTQATTWSERARQHRVASSHRKIADDLVISGSARWLASELQPAIAKIEKPLRACLAGQPTLLVQIDLTVMSGDERAEPQVRATNIVQASVDKIRLRRTLDCLESATRKLRAPKLEGSPGTHASGQFTVIGDP